METCSRMSAMAFQKTIDDETRDRVVEMYRSGAKTAEITEATGVGRSTIYMLLQDAGVAPARRVSKTPSPIDRDLTAPLPLPRLDDPVLAWALERLAELEREVGRLQAMLQQERERT